MPTFRKGACEEVRDKGVSVRQKIREGGVVSAGVDVQVRDLAGRGTIELQRMEEGHAFSGARSACKSKPSTMVPWAIM